MQVIRIFTDIFISPSLSLSQYPDRYTFRAGRNLPDKEFRYLRTVIVTAAVHQGFSRQLCRNSPTSLTFWHWAGVSPHTSSYDFAETCVFGKQSPGSLHCGPYAGHSFFRRYRANLPSSLERVISLPLVYSTHVPVSVYGTGIILSKSMSFSWKKWRKKKYVIPPAKVAFFFNFICSSLSTNKITV